MVGVNKIWLVRDSRGSDKYWLTGDPEFIKFIRGHRRHWGNLVWCRGFSESKKHSYWTLLWLFKTYLVIQEKNGKSIFPHITCRDFKYQTDIGSGLLKIGPKMTFRETWEFDFTGCLPGVRGSVIKEFRRKLKYVEWYVYSFREALGSCPLDKINLEYLYGYKPGTPKPEPRTQEVSWWKRVLKKIGAA